jgi:integrase/recombinase XerD
MNNSPIPKNLSKDTFRLHISLKHLLIHNKRQVGLKFNQSEAISSILKSNPAYSWSEYYQMHYCANNTVNLNWIYKVFKGIAWINGHSFFDKGNNGKCVNPQKVDEWRNRQKVAGVRYVPNIFLDKLESKHYAINTCKSYISHFERFMNAYKDQKLRDIDEREISDYLKHLVIEGKSDSYINQMINSIKFYYEIVLGMPNRFYSVDRPRKKSSLPKVLSIEEIGNIIEATNNIKHRCIVSVLYSAGLRRSELLNLELKDIDSKRMVIYVRDGKQNKDRQTILARSVLDDLRVYFKAYKPQKYLFEGRNGGQYSVTSICKLLDASAKRANIIKKVTPHMLRHSFATHLLENGTDLRYIQELLGHNSTMTTEIYTQVATNMIRKIESPINFLNLNKSKNI